MHALSMIFLLFFITFARSQSEEECANYYDTTVLPAYCFASNQTCLFSNLTILITNIGSNTSIYLLCVNLSDYAIEILPPTPFTNPQILAGQIVIYSKSIQISNGYKAVAQGFVLICNTTININSTWIQSPFVWLYGQDVTVAYSELMSQKSIKSQCSCTNQKDACNLWDFYFPYMYDYAGPNNLTTVFNIANFNLSFVNWSFPALVIYAQNQADLSINTLRFSVVAMYCPTLSLAYVNISTDGLGYPSDNGPGCGYFDEVLNQLLGCTGSGASHGGFGGSSGPDNCNLLISETPYGREFLPRIPGSGGGFFLMETSQFSSGGGVVNIQTSSISLTSSNISVNGLAGIQGGGGGSGGALTIDFTQLSTVGFSKISAKGGNGKSSGGGGRIRIWNHNWRNSTQMANLSNLLISSQGGKECLGALSCGQPGSVLTSPCPPGYSISYNYNPNQINNNFACLPCQNGTYKLTFGYDSCFPCGNRPENSYYTSANSNNYQSYADSCNYTCSDNCKSPPICRLIEGQSVL